MSPTKVPQLLKKPPPLQFKKPSETPSASNFASEPFPWDLINPPAAKNGVRSGAKNGAKTPPAPSRFNRYKQKWRGSVTTTCYHCSLPSPVDETRASAKLEGTENRILVTTVISQRSEKITQKVEGDGGFLDGLMLVPL